MSSGTTDLAIAKGVFQCIICCAELANAGACLPWVMQVSEILKWMRG